MKRSVALLAAALCLLLSHQVFAACGNTIAVNDKNSAQQLICVGTDGGANLMFRQQIVDGTAGANILAIDSSSRAKVIADAGTNMSTASLALEAGGNLATLAGAVSASKFNVNLSSVAAALHISSNVDQISGGTISTAATGVQKVGITGNAGAAFDAAGQNATSPANELLVGCQFNTTPTTITAANMSPLECDNGGNLQANLKTVTGVIGAATSPASMLVGGGVFNTALPTLTNGQSSATQFDSSGRPLVNLSAVAASLHLSSNVDQINGVPPLMGNGVSGTGALRVAQVSDGTGQITANAGTNLNTSALALSTDVQNLAGCAGQTIGNTSVTPFTNAAASTSLKIVTKVSAKNVYICGLNIGPINAANNIALVEGTLTTTQCDTATAGMAGGTTAGTGWNFAANSGATYGNGRGILYKTATVNHDVCLFFSASSQVSGAITWAQF